MTKKIKRLSEEFAENPYVTFHSDGKGRSRVFDENWDFHALNQNRKNLSFGFIDENYRYEIQSYIYAVMQWQREHSDSGAHFSVNTLKKLRYNLTIIVKCWGRSEFYLLSDEREWKKCTKTLKGHSKGQCKQLASAINTLNKVGLVSRYVHKREWTNWIGDDDGEGQAIAWPEAIHGTILKKVVDFVKTYHPYRHQISSAMEKLYKYQDEMYNAELRFLGVNTLTKRQMSTLVVRSSRETRKWPEREAIPNFSFYRRGNWLGRLLRMCFICIGLFSGARKEELLSLNKDSYDDSIAAIPKITGDSTKRYKGEKIRTTWNTAPISKLALELAYDATEAARKYSIKRVDDGFRNGHLTEDEYKSKLQDLESAFISSDLSYDSEKLINKSSLKYKIDGSHDLCDS